MIGRRLIVVTFVAALALLFGPGAIASETQSQQRQEMLGMLAVIPDIGPFRGLHPVVSYMDVKALREIYGVEAPLSPGRTERPEFAAINRWGQVMTRFLVNPFDLPFYVPDDIAERLTAHCGKSENGLPTVLSIDRAIAVGGPLTSETSETTFDIEKSPLIAYGGDERLASADILGAALSARGFVRSGDDSSALWKRREHDTAGEESPAAVQALGGPSFDYLTRLLEPATEVGASRDTVLHSPFPGAVEFVLKAEAEDIDSLADDFDVKALALALTDGDLFNGALIQCVIFNYVFTVENSTVPLVGPYVSAKQKTDFAVWLRDQLKPGLPPYRWGAMADRQDGDDEVFVVALSYESVELAETAAKIVAARLPDDQFNPHRSRLGDLFDLEIQSHVYRVDRLGKAVAIVTLRRRNPVTPEIDLSKHGKLPKLLLDSLHIFRAAPLIVTPSDGAL